MSFLDNLSPDQRQMLVSLPYRIGLYVSQSDTSGGDESTEKELQALSNILCAFEQEIFSSETVQYVIRETTRQKDDWPKWTADDGDVVWDCGKAVDVLSQHVEDKEVSAFKQNMMEIAEAVALAFNEGQNMSSFARFKTWLFYLKQKAKAQRDGHIYKNFDQFLYISPAERSVLEELSKALEINYAV